eukprot:CAMPEP_0194052200 /NCGR_PEP_ID=MMETSP0009_2-20130614/44457_1 /TAXON_ID=210454 /ORGANISM="Grammatophora oceanica, Strain CCMP 410" /LENGTH=418 /DNA_ID=CAMNT_0038699675 /DNA_START=62 /DNA_END=1318 /DNA_ORIENTATION=+
MMMTLWFFLFLGLVMFSVDGFRLINHDHKTTRTISRDTGCLMAKAKKKKKGRGGSAAGVKGFGGSSSGGKGGGVDMDRSKEARAFYDFMENNGAGDNLKRCALGFFPLPGGGKLRGVVALKDMKKGDVLIRIPYEVAVNLGREGGDPTIPALNLLKTFCQTLGETGGDDGVVDRSSYFRMLPPFLGEDCMGSTDFFSDEALEALQAPLVVEETLKRRQRVKSTFDQDIKDDESYPSWLDSTEVTEQHLRWAVWLITSRVLTVQGAEDENTSYRLLIPFLDMCNHDRSSPHILTGRAVGGVGAELKVVAGSNVRAGDQINICYGGGVAGNDRFVQDYGFLDSETAFNIVAQQILGRRRLVEGTNAGRTIASVDKEASIKALEMTSISQDEALLEIEKDPATKSAISYRMGVKKALAKYT